MGDYTFSYIPFPMQKRDGCAQKPRPVILIPFELPEKTITENTSRIASLIDSGADKSVSFKEIGESLGIIFSGSPTEPVDGLTGSEKAWKKPVRMKIGDEILLLEVLWLNRQMDTASDYPFILGRDTLFDAFDIEFVQNSKIILRNREQLTRQAGL